MQVSVEKTSCSRKKTIILGIYSRQVYLLLLEAIEVLSHFIRKYFRQKAVSSTDNKI